MGVIPEEEKASNDYRLSALIIMAIVEDQCRNSRTGIKNAIEGRRAVMTLPMSQLTARLVAIVITKSLEQGVNNVRLTANRPRSQQLPLRATQAPVRDPIMRKNP
jgi:hypothetical protein